MDTELIHQGALEKTSPEGSKKNPAAVYIEGLPSRHSQRTMTNALNKVARHILELEEDTDHLRYMDVHWAALRYEHVRTLKAWLQQQGSVATTNLHLSALRGVAKEAWRLRQMDGEDYQRIADIPNVTGETVLSGHEVEVEELEAILAACQDDTVLGIRDAAALALAFNGLRRSEIVTLSMKDYSKGTLKIYGKGRKERLLPLAPHNRIYLDRWLAVRGTQEGALICAVYKDKVSLRHGHLAPQTVWDIFVRRCLGGDVEAKSPHDGRRWFTSEILELTDAITVSKLLGHSSTDTTQRYDRRKERTKQEAVDKLFIPLV